MKIKTIIVGELETNCYILEKDKKVLIIDPGSDTSKIKDAIGDSEVLKVLITHKHFDHIGSVYDIMDTYKVGKLDFSNFTSDEQEIGPFKFKVLETPGHSADSISFYFEKENSMFVGDFIFKNTIGRCDLPTGDFKTMKQSIKKLKNYPVGTVLYPGHGILTTLQEEKKNNPYFQE